MNKFKGYAGVRPWLAALLLTAFVAGCGGGGGGSAGAGADAGVTPVVTVAPGVVVSPGAVGAAEGTASDPTVRSSSPSNGATNVPTSHNATTATRVTALFSQAVDPATINSSLAATVRTFTLKETSGADVAGTVALDMAQTVATFTPTAAAFKTDTSYTATVTTAVKNVGGTAMANPVTWSFRTAPAAATGQAPVNLGSAGSFAILSKSGISTVPGSLVTGDIGVSPIAQIAITGFSQTMDSSTTFSISPQVAGKIYAADYTPPTPAKMTTAVGDMEIAYTDAAARTLPDFTELGSGAIGGLTLVPGLYKWGTGVSITSDVTLSGSATSVWIFQIAGNLTQASATQVKLAGGALAKNVFWQVGGGAGVDIGTNAHFEGVVLSQTSVALKTGASATGRLLAQTAVTLDQNAVTQPAP